MNLIEIDKQTALDLLERVVALRGADYIYEKGDNPSLSCTYARDGEPSCGVGTALHIAGADIELLTEMDEMYFYAGSSAIHEDDVITLLGLSGYNLDEDAVFIFNEFQEHQDAGFTYGECLTYAKGMNY